MLRNHTSRGVIATTYIKDEIYFGEVLHMYLSVELNVFLVLNRLTVVGVRENFESVLLLVRLSLPNAWLLDAPGNMF